METLTLRPSEIRYSRNNIGCRFSGGTHLTCVFAHLISGSLKVEDLPGIEVLRMNGHWWTVTGNRSLFLARKLEEVGVVETISVRKSWMSPTSDLFKRNFTNVCNGMQITCTEKFLHQSLNEIVSDWQSGQDVIAKWDLFNQVLAVHNNFPENTNHDENEGCQHEDDRGDHGLCGYDEGDDFYGEQCDDEQGQDYYYEDEEYYYEDEDFYYEDEDYYYQGEGYYNQDEGDNQYGDHYYHQDQDEYYDYYGDVYDDADDFDYYDATDDYYDDMNVNSNQEHTGAYDEYAEQDEDDDEDAATCNVM